MSTYSPSTTAGEPGSRPPCATCGAAYRLHRNPILDQRPLEQHEPRLLCPEAYRPDSLEVARRELAAAEATGDEARVFVARGNLQRLEVRR